MPTDIEENTKDSIQLFLKTGNCEPIDVELKAYFDLRDRLDALEYGQEDAKVGGVPSVLNMKVVRYVYHIVVSGPLEWSTLPVGVGKEDMYLI